MKWLDQFKSWVKAQLEILRFAWHCDMRIFDDPGFLTGKDLHPETLAMIRDAKQRAGIND